MVYAEALSVRSIAVMGSCADTPNAPKQESTKSEKNWKIFLITTFFSK